MIRYRLITLLALMLLGGIVACAPKTVGPTASSGYIFSMEAFPSSIFTSHSYTTNRQDRFADVVVEVQDGQGHAVDGIPVVFEVGPSWAQDALITPSRALTQEGTARARLRAGISGIVPITARVEDRTHQVTIAVSKPGSASGGGGSP